MKSVFSTDTRFTIGFLTPSVGRDEICYIVWKSIRDAASRHEASLICFAGDELQPGIPRDNKTNIVYDLARAGNIDGLVLWNSALANFIGLQGLRAFCERYKPLPIIELETEPKNKSENYDYSGMQAAVSHLMDTHQRRQLAFIPGAAGNTASEYRFLAYKDALKQRGIPFDADLIAPNDFWFEDSGRKAVEILIDQRKKSFDALVAANDRIAMGAMEGLQERGLSVPHQVAVIGFDGIQQGEFFTPPLSSVQSPYYFLGNQAIERILAAIKKSPYSEGKIKGKLIIRESCGCRSRSFLKARIEKGHFFHFPGKKGMDSTRDESGRAISDNLLAALRKNTKQSEQEIFVPLFKKYLLQDSSMNNELDGWNDVLSELRAQSARRAAYSSIIDVENLLHQARVLLQEVIVQGLVKKTSSEKRMNEILLVTIQKLNTTFNLDDIFDVITGQFPKLGIKACFISLFESLGEPNEQARLILAFNENGRIPLEAGGKSFPLIQLIPEGFVDTEKNLGLLVMALFFQKEQIGYVIFDAGNTSTSIFEPIRAQLSGSFKGALLIQQIIHNSKILEEGNKALEAFSYSVSHDLRAPLRSIDGFSQALLEDYHGKLDEEGRHYLQRIRSSAQLMAQLIDDMLNLSRITRGEMRVEKVNLSALAQEIAGELERRGSERTIAITIAPDLVVTGDGRLLRIALENLLGNAWKFTAKQSDPKIEFGSTRQEDLPVYFVRDNGAGFDMKYAGRLFGAFQRLHTTEEFPGNGIGLATVQRIIHRHGGRIWAEGKVDEGATFFFMLP